MSKTDPNVPTTLPDRYVNSQPALRSEIKLDDRPGLTVCNTCGRENGTVRTLSFRWYDHQRLGPVMSGGTGIALCSICRLATREVLQAEYNPIPVTDAGLPCEFGGEE